MSVPYRRPSGEDCIWDTIFPCCTPPRENEPGGLSSFRILRLKAMEERVQRMERFAFAGKIAAEIAHEIKNPLAAISGAVQLLHGEAEQDAMRGRLMDIVYREIDRINELVTDFLWMARGAKKSDSQESVTICGVIQEVLALLRNRNKVGAGHNIRTAFRGQSRLCHRPAPFSPDSLESARKCAGGYAGWRGHPHRSASCQQ